MIALPFVSVPWYATYSIIEPSLILAIAWIYLIVPETPDISQITLFEFTSSVHSCEVECDSVIEIILAFSSFIPLSNANLAKYSISILLLPLIGLKLTL